MIVSQRTMTRTLPLHGYAQNAARQNASTTQTHPSWFARGSAIVLFIMHVLDSQEFHPRMKHGYAPTAKRNDINVLFAMNME
mmetsp:Transcript_21749/g.64083  ORF Transcript_21749/g.64083 Transcript_21749/m.64083 type:complete len:82 (-) Transcript_21749:1858-2103(-)